MQVHVALVEECNALGGGEHAGDRDRLLRTTFGEDPTAVFERATGAAPFNAAEDFLASRDQIESRVVYNYVTTNDIIGGNSGSPVIDAEGQVIGAAFDGNIHSLGGSFGYDGSVNRTVVVSTAAVTEALRKVYDQPRLLRELGVD